MKVKISEIKVHDRLRKPDMKKVSEIADSIKTIGLLNPITLDADLNLVSGWHRLEAFKLLGLDEIEAQIHDLNPLKRELAEIDENLIRSELHYLDRGEHLRRRKQIYELLYPETKAGGDRKSEEFKTKRIEGGLKPSFAADTAAKTNLSERTIQQDIQLAKLKPEVKEEIRKIDLPKPDALVLVRKAPRLEDQLKVLEKLKEGKARKVSEAAKIVELEKATDRGARISPTLDADFRLVPDWLAEITSIPDGSLGSIICNVPQEFSPEGFHLLLENAVRLLNDRGKLVIQLGQDQFPALFRTALPSGLSYQWLYANLMQGNHIDSAYIKSNWRPIVVYVKGEFESVKGSDSFAKSFESLNRAEDASLQICTRFSNVGNKILDPFAGSDLMTFVAAAVGRSWIGFFDDQAKLNRAKVQAEEIKYVIANL